MRERLFLNPVCSLADMPAGKKGQIIAIEGGHGLRSRLDVLGIHISKQIEKVSTQWLQGPVIFKLGNTEIAVGFGIAKKIIVQLVNTDQQRQKR